LNSFLAVKSADTPETTSYVAQHYPGLSFNFWPSLVAFSLDPVMKLALELYREITQGKAQLFQMVLFDAALTSFLFKTGGERIFVKFLKGLASNHGQLFLEQRRFHPEVNWPKELKAAVRGVGS
jgi:hypothetical protein